MPRQLEFDENAALTGAMHAFRQHGYRNVSIKILEKQTGLASGSIYNSYGGKQGIFDRAFGHYIETVVKKRIAAHLSHEVPGTGLLDLFLTLLEEPGGQSHGCLLTNCAIEQAGEDSIADKYVSEGFRLLEEGFVKSLSAVPGFPVDQITITAIRLLVFYQGLLVLIRHGHDKAALKKTIIAEIKSIVGEQNA